MQILSNKDVAIQTANKKEVKKLRRKDGWTKVVESKAKIAWKRYGIKISIANIYLVKQMK